MAGILDGRISLVTGAASGIGRATSLVMAREGDRRSRGNSPMFVHADVSRPDDVAGLIGHGAPETS